MSYFSLVGCRFWLDFQWFCKFFIGSFHLQGVFLRYVRRLWKIDALLSIIFKNCILNVFQLLFSSIAFCCYRCCRRFRYIVSLPSEGPALHTQAFTAHFLWTPPKKTNILKPRIFETAAFIASKIHVCMCNEYIENCFFFLQDKVANIWCSISVLIKVKRVLSQTQIIKLRLVIAFYARYRSMLCQSALWDCFWTLLSLNATSTFPIMHLICSPKFRNKHCFQFLLGRLQYPGEMKSNLVMQNLGGGGLGALWEMCKWRITRLRRKMGKNSSPKTDPQLTFPLFAKSNWVALVLACVAPVI